MNLHDTIDNVNGIADDYVAELRRVRPEQLGLDPRAGYRMYADEEAVAVRTDDIRTLNYYGGFEYVDAHDIKVLGEYTFFMSNSNRVQECLDYLEDNHHEE